MFINVFDSVCKGTKVSGTFHKMVIKALREYILFVTNSDIKETTTSRRSKTCNRLKFLGLEKLTCAYVNKICDVRGFSNT